MWTAIFTRNIGWKLLSLGAAVLLWMSVASEPELATLHSVPVEYKGVPDDLEITSDFVENVVLETRGPAGRLRDMREARSAVVLDFSSVLQPGQRTFTIEPSNVSLPRGIQLVRVIPAQLRFRFERRIVREVPVEVRFTDPRDGYAVASYEVTPAKLTIIGPESSVERTTSVVTDRINIGGVLSTSQFRVNCFLSEPLVRFQSPSQVTVRVVVKKK
ncbi:MAG TPA: CdaR family protein [Bryobacteraceae bacterium]|nr:CdaR family protein [Bryobacteraceae bacterium]